MRSHQRLLRSEDVGSPATCKGWGKITSHFEGVGMGYHQSLVRGGDGRITSHFKGMGIRDHQSLLMSGDGESPATCKGWRKSTRQF